MSRKIEFFKTKNTNYGYIATVTFIDCMGNITSETNETVTNGYNIYAVLNSGIIKIKTH